MGKCHIQVIAVDEKKGYIYYSFTTKLIKATLDGKILGTLDGLAGHLGCIAFKENDGCVYGWNFPLGSTGLYSFGDGEWLICRHFRTEEGQCGEIEHYEWNEITPFVKLSFS